MATAPDVLNTIAGITGLSSVTMAASAVAKTVGDVTDLEFANICPCEDVKLGQEGSPEPESIQGAGRFTVVSDVSLVGGAMYCFSCKVQLNEDPPGQMWTTMELISTITLATGQRKSGMFGKMNHVRQADGWVEMGGDFTAPENATKLMVQLSVWASQTKVTVDRASMKLTHILDNPDWRSAAERRIKLLRKGNITLKITVPEDYEPDKLTFKLSQKKSNFPWGAAVDAGHLGGRSPQDEKYRQFLFEYFTWATPGNEVKWRLMERRERQVNFRGGDACLNILENANMKVRGHCLMWARTRKIPPWLSPKPTEDVEKNVYRRLDYCASHFKDRFSHWDVNNEQLHEAWYAEKLQQPDFLSRIFKYFHEQEPGPTLFVNDFFVFGEGVFTQAYKQQVKKLQRDNAPVGGIGIQAHISGYKNIAFLTKRLEILSEPGIPLWLTEFDVNLKNDEQKAQMYEDVARLCFSHPSIHGIVFWGFLDKIVSGSDLQWNESGKRLHKLWREEWWTQETLSLPPGTECGHQVEIDTCAFHGSYILTAQYKEQSVWKKDFELIPNEHLDILVEL